VLARRGARCARVPSHGAAGALCAAGAAGSPSNNNGEAKEAIVEHNPAQTLPLPPVGTAGNGQGQGEDHCANA
jgi:hypothetical protein